MTPENKEQECKVSQALPHENIIKKCWNPNCRKVATCQDGSGWEWCDEHVDQEKTGSVLHTAQTYYDVDFYQNRIKEKMDILTQATNHKKPSKLGHVSGTDVNNPL